VLHGSDTWPIRTKNEVALQRAEMRMIRWMCDVRLQDRVPTKGLKERERLGLVDIISALKQMGCNGMGMWLRKEDNDSEKKCMAYEVEGVRP